MKTEVLKGKTGELAFTPYQNNQPAVASAATVILYKPGGAVLQSSANATIAASGKISYALTSTHTADLGENYVAKWTYTVSGSEFYETMLFDVVLNRLGIAIVDEDLLIEQRDILERSDNFRGVVDSASSTTVVDADLKMFVDDYWNGGLAQVYAGSAVTTRQLRRVTDFVQSTGTITVSASWGSTPDNTYRYIIYKGFEDKIQRAFDLMMVDVCSKGYRPSLIIESRELAIPHIKKALALICADYMTQPGDKWDVLSQRYAKEYREMLDLVKFQYDKNEDGLITGSEEDNDMGQVRMRR